PKGYAGPGTAQVSATTAHKLAAVGFNDQLVQAMAGFGGRRGGGGGSKTAPPRGGGTQQPVITAPTPAVVAFLKAAGRGAYAIRALPDLCLGLGSTRLAAARLLTGHH